MSDACPSLISGSKIRPIGESRQIGCFHGEAAVLHVGEGVEEAMKRKALIAAALVLAAACASASGSEEDGPIDASGIQVIAIRAGPLDVRVRGGEDGEVSLDTGLSTAFFSEHESPRVMHRRKGSRLNVWIENDGLFQTTPSGQIRIRAPRDTDLVVETSSGRVFVDGVGKGKCSIRTVSGRIRVHRMDGRLSVDSVSGSIDIDSTEGSVNARSVSGGISGRKVSLTHDSSFSSISGDIEIGLDSPLETLAFDLKSVSGSIRIGSIRAERGLRMGFARTRVSGHTISGALSFQ